MSVTILLLLLIQSICWAKVERFDVLKSQKESVPFKQVCLDMGHKHVLLAQRQDDVSIDCMGQNVTAMDFCKSKFGQDKSFMRGFIHENQIVCQRGASLSLTISCDERDKKYCSEAKAGCLQLQAMFAVNLTLFHFSLIDNRLSCYYSGD